MFPSHDPEQENKEMIRNLKERVTRYLKDVGKREDLGGLLFLLDDEKHIITDVGKGISEYGIWVLMSSLFDNLEADRKERMLNELKILQAKESK
jgi:hypothetical protein